MRTVSSFTAVGGAPYRYSYLLVVPNSYLDSVRDELNRQLDAFAADLYGEGEVARAFPERIYEVAREVLDKPWPGEIGLRMGWEGSPFIVVIDRPFREFDPREDPHAVIWLGDFERDPSTIRPLLQSLARKTRSEEDVIIYLCEVAREEERIADAAQNAEAIGIAARMASYVEIKPRVFGVGIDLSAILRDIAERRRG